MNTTTSGNDVPSTETWTERTLPSFEALTKNDVLDMLHGRVAGLRVPAVLTAAQCGRVIERIRRFRRKHGRPYAGNLNIATPLNIPSHWEFKYVRGQDAWFDYFRNVGAATRRRRALFRGMPDPLDGIVQALAHVWGKPVKRLLHPRFGWRLYAGIIRDGAPSLHFDWAPFDLDHNEVVMQAGANFYLANFGEGGDLKVYKTYGMDHPYVKPDGRPATGNYDLAHRYVEGARSCTIPCEVGDFVITSNRFLHEVTPGDEPSENRVVLGFHLALLADGSLVIFS